MSHGYTPGLAVTASALLLRERRLPLKGRVLVAVGDVVEARTVVARAELPGEVRTINLAARLAVDPAQAPSRLRVAVGAAVRAGEVLAAGSSLFGLVRTTIESPCDGVLESVSPVTGQLLVREPPVPVEVDGYVHGRVVEILPEEGVIVETQAAFLQGIFGVGGETSGALRVAVEGPSAELRPDQIVPAMRGHVVVAGAHVSWATLERARATGVAAIVAGGMDDTDLRRLLGRDLGVAITGSEELGITVILTEGFGRIPISGHGWDLLRGHEGREASVNGATQIRAGVQRPEVLIPRGAGRSAPERPRAVELGVGSLVRLLRSPHFGRLGRVVELPPEPRRLETESLARVAVVEYAEGGRVVVPRANLEVIVG